MLVAKDKKGNKVCAEDANKENKYFCPACNKELRLRQGDVNIWHFAHTVSNCVDDWNHDMSEWHYGMQSRFPKECREVMVTHNGETHRADILCGDKVIEFQHSPISVSEIMKRNDFYEKAGYKVAWVFDVREQYESGQIEDVERDNALMYSWKNSKHISNGFYSFNNVDDVLVLWLYWIDVDGMEQFNKVIWSVFDEYKGPSLRRFIIADYTISINSDNSLNVEDFFITKRKLLTSELKKLDGKYEKLYIGVPGYKKESYTCPLRQEFGLKLYGEKSCVNCRHCGLLNNVYDRKWEVYCCYPKVVNENSNCLIL